MATHDRRRRHHRKSDGATRLWKNIRTSRLSSSTPVRAKSGMPTSCRLLETDSLPDVFLINRLANFLPFNILADITDLYDNDPDTDYIFPSVQELGMYKDVRYAVPTFIYPQIWILNLEILEAAGVAIPGYDWTYEQAEAIAQATTNENTHIIGMYGCDFYHRELPENLENQSRSERRRTGNRQLVVRRVLRRVPIQLHGSGLLDRDERHDRSHARRVLHLRTRPRDVGRMVFEPDVRFRRTTAKSRCGAKLRGAPRTISRKCFLIGTSIPVQTASRAETPTSPASPPHPIIPKPLTNS
ncbi:MAG: hypothetical protein MZU97_20035 [Bacillus subtilis]|nr:hypothetical protein [Bacillus subtilis]